jgi:hypothetical protein
MKLYATIFLRLGLAQVLLGALTGCSPAPMPVSQSSRDPSSPTAPEGVTPTVAASAAPATPAPSHEGHEHHGQSKAPATSGHEGHDHAGTPSSADAGSQATAYVCPMHPEVTSSAPALCPKCNMKLVPKK